MCINPKYMYLETYGGSNMYVIREWGEHPVKPGEGYFNPAEGWDGSSV
jgi:hypothetical protein